MIYYAKTHKGNVRELNEDAIYIPEGNAGFYVMLADGMGGHNAGDVASNLAVSAVKSFFSGVGENDVTEEDVREALFDANWLVWKQSCENANRKGMGTTATLAVFARGHAYIGQVGDSRAYLYRDGALTQITTDHSYVQVLIDKGLIKKEEAATHPQKNVITRAIGTECHIEVDSFTIKLNQNDVILLCSDGLSNAVPDEEIAQILSGGLDIAAQQLVQAALDNGGTDNVSVVIAQTRGGER